MNSLRDSQTTLIHHEAMPNERLRQAIIFLTDRDVNSDAQFEDRLNLIEEHILTKYPAEGFTFDPQLYNQVKAMVEHHKRTVTTSGDEDSLVAGRDVLLDGGENEPSAGKELDTLQRAIDHLPGAPIFSAPSARALAKCFIKDYNSRKEVNPAKALVMLKSDSCNATTINRKSTTLPTLQLINEYLELSFFAKHEINVGRQQALERERLMTEHLASSGLSRDHWAKLSEKVQKEDEQREALANIRRFVRLADLLYNRFYSLGIAELVPAWLLDLEYETPEAIALEPDFYNYVADTDPTEIVPKRVVNILSDASLRRKMTTIETCDKIKNSARFDGGPSAFKRGSLGQTDDVSFLSNKEFESFETAIQMGSGVITNLISILSDIGVADRSGPRDVRLTRKELPPSAADRVIYLRNMNEELPPPVILDKLVFRATVEYADILRRYGPQIEGMILKPQATILSQGCKLPEDTLSFLPPPPTETNLVREVEPYDGKGKLKRAATEKQRKQIAEMLLGISKDLEQSGLGNTTKEVSATNSPQRGYGGITSRTSPEAPPGQSPRRFTTLEPYTNLHTSTSPRTAKPRTHREGKRDVGPRVKTWQYGGPSEVEIWHADMPPFLPFGETIHIARWESQQIELDLARGLQGVNDANKSPATTPSSPVANASSLSTSKSKGKQKATEVAPYKRENLRKLPYYESGTRFKLPEPFPQLDALDEKLDIFNLDNALHKIYTYTEKDKKRGCVPKKHLPRLTRISTITSPTIDRKGKGKATTADLDLAPDADVLTIPDEESDPDHHSPAGFYPTPEPPRRSSRSPPADRGPSRQFGTIDPEAYRRIRAEQPGARRPGRPASASAPRAAKARPGPRHVEATRGRAPSVSPTPSVPRARRTVRARSSKKSAPLGETAPLSPPVAARTRSGVRRRAEAETGAGGGRSASRSVA